MEIVYNFGRAGKSLSQELGRAYKKAEDLYVKYLPVFLDKCATIIEDKAKASSQFTDRTGNLRQSIQHVTTRAGESAQSIIWPGMDYGAHVHEGNLASSVNKKISGKIFKWVSPDTGEWVYRPFFRIGKRPPGIRGTARNHPRAEPNEELGEPGYDLLAKPPRPFLRLAYEASLPEIDTEFLAFWRGIVEASGLAD